MIIIQQVDTEQVWKIRHKVMYPNLPFEAIKLAEDADAIHLGIIEDSQTIGIVSLFVAPDGIQFRKFATLDEYQGRGYGSRLLNYVIHFSQSRNVGRLWCNARVNASGFYRKFGFSETDTRFNKDGYDFIVMELKLKQV